LLTSVASFLLLRSFVLSILQMKTGGLFGNLSNRRYQAESQPGLQSTLSSHIRRNCCPATWTQ
jgi:hypothetical protein